VTCKKNFYLTIINAIKDKTNLTSICKDLSISKQQLNYYLRELKKKGFVYNKGRGWWELTPKGKNPTKYGIFLEKDMVRGHAYIWEVKLSKIPKDWDKRLEILEKKNINYKIVGARESTPRIKALGRKVWLCNNHLRIFDIEKASYYGENAVDARKNSFYELLRVVQTLERKLGVNLRPFDWEFRKEHYALIRNDLAIEHNRKGIILRVSDEEGEWLLVDDSLEQGGELENIGKKALVTNLPMQKWWNDQKKTKFEVTPSFLMEQLSGMLQIQQMHSHNIVKHQKVLDEMLVTLKKIQDKL